MSIWYHLIYVTVVNAWFLYRTVKTKGARKSTKILFDFSPKLVTLLLKCMQYT